MTLEDLAENIRIECTLASAFYLLRFSLFREWVILYLFYIPSICSVLVHFCNMYRILTFTSHIQKRNKRKLHGLNKTLNDGLCLAGPRRLNKYCISVVQLSHRVNCMAWAPWHRASWPCASIWNGGGGGRTRAHSPCFPREKVLCVTSAIKNELFRCSRQETSFIVKLFFFLLCTLLMQQSYDKGYNRKYGMWDH